MNVFNRQLYVHLIITFAIFTFAINYTIAQELPFEIEDHFEIHEDVDLGIKLMPEGGCENSTSDEYGFVFKRRVIEINTGAPFPPEGECGQRFGDPFLEFYPSDFNATGGVVSSLGTEQYPWGTLNVRRIELDENNGLIRGQRGSLYGNQIILPAGRDILQEGDNLIDDGVIFSPTQGQSNGDIALWSSDDIVVNFKAASNQPDGQFAVTEGNPTNVRFKVGTGGNIFMPALPSTISSYTPVVFNPADGQLYYQQLTTAKNTIETNQDIQSQIQRLQEDNMDLRNQLKNLMDEFGKFKKTVKTKPSQN